MTTIRAQRRRWLAWLWRQNGFRPTRRADRAECLPTLTRRGTVSNGFLFTLPR